MAMTHSEIEDLPRLWHRHHARLRTATGSILLGGVDNPAVALRYCKDMARTIVNAGNECGVIAVEVTDHLGNLVLEESVQSI